MNKVRTIPRTVDDDVAGDRPDLRGTIRVRELTRVPVGGRIAAENSWSGSSMHKRIRCTGTARRLGTMLTPGTDWARIPPRPRSSR